MKVLEFNYTKANNKQSERVVMMLEQPVEHYQGIDLTELDVESQVDFVAEYNQLYDQFRQQQLNLLAKFDLENKYRKFTPSNMHDVKVEYV